MIYGVTTTTMYVGIYMYSVVVFIKLNMDNERKTNCTWLIQPRIEQNGFVHNTNNSIIYLQDIQHGSHLVSNVSATR